MGKGEAGNISRSIADYDEDLAGYTERTVNPYNNSAFFESERDNPDDLVSFLENFDGESEIIMNQYWIDDSKGLQKDKVSPASANDISDALEEQLAEIENPGYHLGIYEDDQGFRVTGGISGDLPRTIFQRMTNDPIEIGPNEGGLVFRGNLNVSKQDLYERAKKDNDFNLQEVRMWPQVKSALNT
ncbi:MAG: hypothetical protein V5A72_00790, partial [Candidatus Nanohaloarchaea archaeon]